MLKLALMSDLHLEFYKDQGHAFIDAVDLENADICILAGDIATGKHPAQFSWIFKELLNKCKHIIHVPGNHSYYGTTPEQAHHSLVVAADNAYNIHLFNEPHSETIMGQKFYAGTMWFREDPNNWLYEHHIADFSHIKNFKPWVYDQNAEFEYYFKDVDQSTIVVSHHLPSEVCVAPFFKGDQLNRFFLNDMSEQILDQKPKLWAHGHTHTPVDVTLGDTRIVAQPKGYPREFSRLYKPLLIEV